MGTPPRVAFHQLDGDDARARRVFACRQAEEAWLAGQSVFLHCNDAAEAALLDDLLWTFADRAFLPHAQLADVDPPATDLRVLVGHGGWPADWPARDLLVNLAAEVPGGAEGFARIIELVEAEPELRTQGRKRFADYRERGWAPEFHRHPA